MTFMIAVANILLMAVMYVVIGFALYFGFLFADALRQKVSKTEFSFNFDSIKGRLFKGARMKEPVEDPA